MGKLRERKSELAAVEALLERRGGLLLVEGRSGIGKTSLVNAAAYDPDAFRAFLATVMCLALPEDALTRPDIRDTVERIGDKTRRPSPARTGNGSCSCSPATEAARLRRKDVEQPSDRRAAMSSRTVHEQPWPNNGLMEAAP